MLNLRRTKIIATLGPATDPPLVLQQLLAAGADLLRLNFSHGTAADHQKRAALARELASKNQKEIALIADLQGPKIRISRFKNGPITLKSGATFYLDSALDPDAGNENEVGIDYKDLPADLSVDDMLLLDDGRLSLKVQSVTGTRIETIVITGGILSNHKGINRKGGGLSAAALTEKDKKDLLTALAIGVDYVAISFPKTAQDIYEAKDLIADAAGKAAVIAKIERAEALSHIDEIIHASDAIMIARGDLGVEIDDAQLPSAQKMIIQKCRSLNKAVITATQMMETMIHNSIPTRAEVFDVANAVLDTTDAVMLSGETASGHHPALVVETMAHICSTAEQNPLTKISKHRVECRFERIDESIAMSAMYLANHFSVSAIVALTESGNTALWMSRIRTATPIFALSRHQSARQRMALYRGVYPIPFDITQYTISSAYQKVFEILLEKNLIKVGEYVLFTHGDHLGVDGGSNTLKILQVKEEMHNDETNH